MSIKACITTYMGYVLSGAGAGLFGMAAIRKSTDVYFMSYASASIAVVISLVLFVIFYKFNSHNRGAGYCKVLTHELYDSQSDDKDSVSDLLSWEICVHKLRDSDSNRSMYLNNLDHVNLKGLDMDIFKTALSNTVGSDPEIDRHKYFEGWKIIIKSLVFSFKKRSSSWGYPIFVSNIFFVLTSIFMIVSLYNFFDLLIAHTQEMDIHENFFHFISAFSVVIFLTVLWTALAGKLYALMYGSSTVNAFFLRFLPTRSYILSRYNLNSKYDIDIKEIEREFINYK